MKWFPVFILLVSTLGCGSNDEKKPPFFSGDEKDLCVLEKPDFVVQREKEDSIRNERLTRMLDKPIDLPFYKKEFGPSNSGGVTDESLFDTPDTIGFMYQYMLFNKLGSVLDGHPSEADLFTDFRIMVYKFGNVVPDWYDNNEVLMGIQCALNNSTLGDLNVYGLTRVELTEKFGDPQIEKGQNLIYMRDHNLLSVHFFEDEIKEHGLSEGTVDWYKFVRLNKGIDLDNSVPDFLLKY